MEFVNIDCPSRTAFTPYAAFTEEELQTRLVDDAYLRNQIARLLGGIFPGHINSNLANGEHTYSEYIGAGSRGQLLFNVHTLFSGSASSLTKPYDFAQQLFITFNIADRRTSYDISRYLIRAAYMDKWDIVETIVSMFPRLKTSDGINESCHEMERLCAPLFEECVL